MSLKKFISTDKIIERLQYENIWWDERRIPEYFKVFRRRLFFDLFFPFVSNVEIRRAVVLMGPRRVGKTVMMYHTIDQLIENGINPQKLFFIGIDNPIYVNLSLQDILDLCCAAVKTKSLKDCYVFIDEIQYLKDWEQHLKVLVDSYPATKFIVSGSATAALKRQSTESGAGRFTDFRLPPLTFQEFIFLKDKSHLAKLGNIQYGGTAIPFWLPINVDEFNELFIEYLNFGGYPEVVFSEKLQNNMSRHVKNDIVDKVLLRDLPSLYGIKDVQELYRFFTYIAYNTGNEFSYESMARDSGIQKETLKKYLEYLEASFLVKVLYKIDNNAKRLQRVTSFKIYLTNPSLRTALFSPVKGTDDEMGNLVETGILSQWMHNENMDLAYARWRNGNSEGEVDLVLLDHKRFKPAWAVEIKWSNRYFSKPNELKSLLQFCGNQELKHALVTTIDVTGIQEISNVGLSFVPASIYAYNIGDLTLKSKSSIDQMD